MCMGDDNLPVLHGVVGHDRQHVINVIAWINNHGFARDLIAHDGAIALQWSNRKNLMDHVAILAAFTDRSPQYWEVRTLLAMTSSQPHLWERHPLPSRFWRNIYAS